MLAALILILTGVDSPFFFFTLGTALLGGLVYGYPGAALFSVMLIIVYAYAIHLRSPIDETLRGLPHDRRAAVAVPDRRRRRRGRAAAAGPPGRGRGDAGRAGAHAGRAGRARAARARHARLAGQDRARDRLRRAGALAPDPGRPVGAEEDARKLAVDARTAAQEARELLSGLRGRDDAELPLPTAIRSEAARWGERTGHARRRLARRRRAAAVAGAARAALDPQGGAGQRRALRARDARRRPPAPARRARGADRRRRRRRLRGARRPRGRSPAWAPSACAGCASARGWRAAT